jgi:hypothetical protein
MAFPWCYPAAAGRQQVTGPERIRRRCRTHAGRRPTGNLATPPDDRRGLPRVATAVLMVCAKCQLDHGHSCVGGASSGNDSIGGDIHRRAFRKVSSLTFSCSFSAFLRIVVLHAHVVHRKYHIAMAEPITVKNNPDTQGPVTGLYFTNAMYK